MYSRYNVETIDKVIDIDHSLHNHQTELESVFQSKQVGNIYDVMVAMYFGFVLQMCMTPTEVKHVNQYHLLELASKDLLCGITTL